MVNVEADALAGPLLARRAAEAGLPLLLRIWRPAGLDRGDRRLGAHSRLGGDLQPARGLNTCPSTIPRHPRRSGTITASAGSRWRGRLQRQMFNSFLDGTKSAFEMAAVANAAGLAQLQTAWPFRLAASTTCRMSCGRAATGASFPRGFRRGRLLPRARRKAGVPRPALGRLRHLRSALRLCPQVLCRLRAKDGQHEAATAQCTNPTT